MGIYCWVATFCGKLSFENTSMIYVNGTFWVTRMLCVYIQPIDLFIKLTSHLLSSLKRCNWDFSVKQKTWRPVTFQYKISVTSMLFIQISYFISSILIFTMLLLSLWWINVYMNAVGWWLQASSRFMQVFSSICELQYFYIKRLCHIVQIDNMLWNYVLCNMIMKFTWSNVAYRSAN